MPAYQYIYVMKGLNKTYPGGREVLKDIWLSFLPGAKIGVLGANGAGKSTLLRIMAGEEHDFTGEAWAAEGARVGYLPQEPVLDDTKDVFGNVIEGLAETKALHRPLRGGQRSLCRRALTRRDGRADRRAGRIAGKDRSRRGLGSRPDHRDRDGRVALPAGRGAGDQPLRRRAAPRRTLPAAVAAPRPVAARRADQPSRRRVGGVAAAFSRRLPGHRRHGNARPLFPRRGRRLDPRARPRPRHPVRGQLFGLARAKAAAARAGGPPGGGAAAHPRTRARMGAAEPAGAPSQKQGAAVGL